MRKRLDFFLVSNAKNRGKNPVQRRVPPPVLQNKNRSKNCFGFEVEMKRFELSTLRMRTVRSSQLSYTPEQMIL